jgi:two-component system, chemotaxis family, sensor kinase CheA
MGAREHELLQKLLSTFRVEAKEHISAISSGLAGLEQASPPQNQSELIESIFREAHSLKGAARAVNLLEVESLCQSLESEFSKWKARSAAPSPEELERLHQGVGALSAMLVEAGVSAYLPLAESPGGPVLQSQTSVARLTPKPAQAVNQRSAQRVTRRLKELPDEGLRIPDTVRVSTLKLDALLREAEELIPAKVAGAYRVSQLRDVNSTLLLWEDEWKKARPQARALQRLLDGRLNAAEKGLPQFGKLLSLLSQNESALRSIRSQLTTLLKNLDSDRRVLDRKVADLVADAKSMSMLRFTTLLEAFPKLVRDLCRDCGKNAQLLIEGGDIEADRRLLEEIKDPLMHLVRNCIDHGIESPDERARKQKAARATITIAVSPKSGGRVEIVVSDDGAGVDTQKLRTAANRLGLVSEAKAREMNDQEVLSLVFHSGLSTSSTISEVSGRGLGLAIVREKAQKLGGVVDLETQPGVGTVFRLVLPLTMASFRGILVRVGENLFVVPSMHARRLLRVDRSALKRAGDREIVQVDGRATPVARLGVILRIGDESPVPNAAEKIPALLLALDSEEMVVLVDEVLKEQEMVVKNLGTQLRRVRNIQGATILETGKVAAVLSVADLFQSAANADRTVSQAERQPKSVPVNEVYAQ